MDDLPGPEGDRVVERDETYDHEEYGSVEVTGIWRGVKQVDNARNTDQKDVIIVRYSTNDDGEQVDELTDTLGEFIEETE
ncbi:hypothetical protein HTZ84_09880 [Haloterrigena sp. SYSU A558-1]|uniref:Uncharacterized protein n=1 Tax=Haloterrigena gelatinilytica TaxID=2741724 RepID=A0ABX2LDH9_9EURY|nr:hypothetical protein [Haloterrigena gelatinilytica]NUC72615.1 hypothetical protein [Haloterrigena gelatinilytica]